MNTLYVSHSPPLPATFGGHQRTAHLLAALSEVSDVDLLLLRDIERFKGDTIRKLKTAYCRVRFAQSPSYSDRGLWRLLSPINPALINRLAFHLSNKSSHYRPVDSVRSLFQEMTGEVKYDLVIGRYLRPTAISGALSFSPLILDVDDLDYEEWYWRLMAPTLPIYQRPLVHLYYNQIQGITLNLLSKCSHIWVSNSKDLEELTPLPVTLLPNIPSHTPDELSTTETDVQSILTVASFRRKPNYEGVNHFVNNIWPYIYNAKPATMLRIVGRDLSKYHRDRWNEIAGVEAVGFVDDLTNEYMRCNFTVAPIYFGGGSNIKVLESIAHRRTCVVTPFVHRGFSENLQHEESYLVSSNDSEFVKNCLFLLDNPDLTSRLARRGYDIICRKYTYSRFRDIVHDTIDTVIN